MKKLVIFIICILITTIGFAEKADPFLFKPKKGNGPFPIVLWLHGYRGYSKEGYYPKAKKEDMQAHADQLKAVIIGFPATTELGDDTQQWSEEPVADHAYIQDRLNNIAKEISIDRSRIVLFGFSQGAMVAGDLSSIYPDHYLGAIMMSPGGMGLPKITEIKKGAHTTQKYFCFCGAKEHPGNIELTKAYANHLKHVLGADVSLKLYPKVKDHIRPPDFMEKFPKWVAEILKKRQQNQKKDTAKITINPVKEKGMKKDLQ